MATITERLALIISADADKAVRAFEKTANSAQTQMNKTTKSLDRAGAAMTKFGARGLAVAGTLAAGLAKLAQGAMEDQKAQQLLARQLETTAGATQEQVAQVEAMIDSMQRATGVADTELRPAFAQLVRVSGSLGGATDLLQTAMNVSAGTGRDLNSVVMALSRASTGSFGSISRLGVALSDNVKESKDFSAVIEELNRIFQGAAGVAAETYAGRVGRAQVALSELGEQIGTATMPIIEKGATGLADIANKLGSFDKATGGVIGKLATFGTLALAFVSSMALIGGGLIRLRTQLVTTEGSLTRLGSAMKTLGIVFGTFVVSDLVFSVLNSVNDIAGKTAGNLADVTSALNSSSPQVGVAAEAFGRLAKTEGEALKMSHLWTDWGKEIQLIGRESKENIEDIDSAFRKVLETSGTEAARALLTDWAAATDALDHNSQQYKDNIMLLERYGNMVSDTEVILGGFTGGLYNTGNAVQKLAGDFRELGISMVLTQEYLNNFMGPVASRNLDELLKYYNDFKNGFSGGGGVLPEIENNTNRFLESLRETASKIKDQFVGMLDLGGTYASAEGKFKPFMKAFTARGNAMSKFAQNLATLRDKGLNDAAINEILSMGIMDGSQFAADLLEQTNSARSIQQINRAYSQANTAGMAAGSMLAVPQNVETNVNITVTSANPQAVVDALRKYMRTNGTVPIQVSSVA